MLAILTDSKPAISTLRKLDKGTTPPRSEIEARIIKELCRRTDKDTCVAWVKGHKGIEGNEEPQQTSCAERLQSWVTSRRGLSHRLASERGAGG